MRNKRVVDDQIIHIQLKEDRDISISTLMPEWSPCHLSEAPEMSQGDDVEAMVARLDEKWRKIKDLIRAPGGSIIEEQADLEVSLGDLKPADKVEKKALDNKNSWSNSLLSPNTAKFAVTPLEADAIITRMEKIDEETNIRERLAKAEKQSRGLRLYAIFCTLIVLFTLISDILILMESHDLSKNSLGQNLEPKIASSKPAPSPQETSSPAPKALPHQTSGTAAGQELPTVISSIKEPEITKVEYVGAFNSNKYHYRSCKWTQYIGPTNLRVFQSVAEAQKAVYVRCLTCQPPVTDEPQLSIR